MSLHAQITPETRQRLAFQRRTSTLTSIIVALLVMALISVVLMIIALASSPVQLPLPQYRGAVNTPEEKPRIKKTNVHIAKRPSPPSKVPRPTVVSMTTSPVSVPIPKNPRKEGDFSIGNDEGIGGNGFDDGQGDGPGGPSGIPTIIKKRCSHQDRMERLLDNGGNKECEDAVVKALRWLKQTQIQNGSWTNQKPVAMTGLALLTFLGHCETAGSEEFGESVLAGITYLVDVSLKNNGKLATDLKDDHWCYEHSIATYALAEAYTLCVGSFGENIPQLKEAIKSAGQFLINSQHQSGGWDYAYSEDSDRGGDVSIAGWHLQALKACKLTGLDFANLNRCYKKGVDYLERMQAPSGALGYSSPNGIHGDGTTLAAVGALCFQIWKSPSNPSARKAVKFMAQKMKFGWNTAESDLYGNYYAVQAMINNGGKEWENYNSLFRDEVLTNQDDNGSFKPVGSGQKINAVGASFANDGGHGRHYRTCLATLILESYYRFLPTSEGK